MSPRVLKEGALGGIGELAPVEEVLLGAVVALEREMAVHRVVAHAVAVPILVGHLYHRNSHLMKSLSSSCYFSYYCIITETYVHKYLHDCKWPSVTLWLVHHLLEYMLTLNA